jgi:2-methylcitrate dehydratase
VAAAAVFRHANHEAFTADAMANPEVLRLSAVTELREDRELAARIPVIRSARVTMELADGRVLSDFTENPRGHFANPFTDEELAQKFDRLAGRYLTGEGVQRVRKMLAEMEKLQTARELTDTMRTFAQRSGT